MSSIQHLLQANLQVTKQLQTSMFLWCLNLQLSLLEELDVAHKAEEAEIKLQVLVVVKPKSPPPSKPYTRQAPDIHKPDNVDSVASCIIMLNATVASYRPDPKCKSKYSILY